MTTGSSIRIIRNDNNIHSRNSDDDDDDDNDDDEQHRIIFMMNITDAIYTIKSIQPWNDGYN